MFRPAQEKYKLVRFRVIELVNKQLALLDACSTIEPKIRILGNSAYVLKYVQGFCIIWDQNNPFVFFSVQDLQHFAQNTHFPS